MINPPSRDYVVVGHILRALKDLTTLPDTTSPSTKKPEATTPHQHPREKSKEEKDTEKEKKGEKEEQKEKEEGEKDAAVEEDLDALETSAINKWRGNFIFKNCNKLKVCVITEECGKKHERNKRVRVTRRRTRWVQAKLTKKVTDQDDLELAKRLAREIIHHEENTHTEINYSLVLTKAAQLQAALVAKGIIKPKPKPKPAKAKPQPKQGPPTTSKPTGQKRRPNRNRRGKRGG